jgi:hypothetical protein
MGWEWKEEFTDNSPARGNAGGNGNPAPARNDARRMLKRGPAKRPVPKL